MLNTVSFAFIENLLIAHEYFASKSQADKTTGAVQFIDFGAAEDAAAGGWEQYRPEYTRPNTESMCESRASVSSAAAAIGETTCVEKSTAVIYFIF